MHESDHNHGYSIPYFFSVTNFGSFQLGPFFNKHFVAPFNNTILT